MAGIGFVLRRLAKEDNLIGLVQAYGHSALASAGPWLFTVLALGGIMAIGVRLVHIEVLFEFRAIIVYNFAFSLVFTGPIYMVATRYLADRIYEKNVTWAPGMMIGSLLLTYGTQFPIVAWFYLFYAKLTPGMALGAVVNFFLISGIWLVSVFVTALKDYKAVTRAFALGMILSVFASGWLAQHFQTAGMLSGFSIGLLFIIGSLMAKVFSEYPYRYKAPFDVLGHFKKYWELAVSGVVYNVAVWIDKWVMWFAPEREEMKSGLILYPNYDSAMFLAYLTIVPSMALFIFSVETNFYEHYLRFYRDIQNKANFKKIQRNHAAIIESIFRSARSFVIVQGSLCALIILIAPNLFQALNINYLQIGIFRYGVLGAFFHVLLLFLMIMLSYFDNRRLTIYIQISFMVANGVFTWMSMQLGFEYYGYGYFLSSLFTFVVAAILTFRYVYDLPYHTFVTTNTSVD